MTLLSKDTDTPESFIDTSISDGKQELIGALKGDNPNLNGNTFFSVNMARKMFSNQDFKDFLKNMMVLLSYKKEINKITQNIHNKNYDKFMSKDYSKLREDIKDYDSSFRTACMLAYYHNDIESIKKIEDIIIYALNKKHNNDNKNSLDFKTACINIENNTLLNKLGLQKGTQITQPIHTTIKEYIKDHNL